MGRGAGGLQSMGSQRVRCDLATQVSFNFMVAVTICSDLEPPKIKSFTVSIVSPSICHEVMGPDAKIFVFCLSFHSR